MDGSKSGYEDMLCHKPIFVINACVQCLQINSD